MAAVKKLVYSISVIMAATLLAFHGVAFAEDVTVEAVTVSIKSSEVPPPQKVKKRMELSIATVGDQVLVGRKVAELNANRPSYENLIKEVFDRVLVGYYVQQVTISPGVSTHISVVISPLGEVVKEVKLDIDYGGISPAAVALIKQDMGNIEETVDSILIGMPVDSIDWAAGISKTVMREVLADKLPEFRPNIEVVPGTTTVVKLSLMPSGSVVRDVKVTLRSGSIPNILLLSAHSPLEEEAKDLRGLPVAFVERHSRYFENNLVDSVAKRPIVKDYGLKLNSQFNAGTETEAIVNVETEKYKITLEGYLDVGRTVDNVSVRFHVGKYFSKTDELFLETNFIPGSVAWNFSPGWGHKLGGKTEVGIKYQLNDKQADLWMNQELGDRWSLRLERIPVKGHDELGIRYKLHDFLTAEYVFTNNDRWLRLVANL